MIKSPKSKINSGHKDFLRSQSVVRRRRKRRMRRFVTFVCLALVLFGALTSLLWLKQLSIQKIVVAGLSKEKSESINQEVSNILEGSYFGVFPKQNIFLYPKKYIMSTIMGSHPEIGSVDLHTEQIHTLNVRVTERTPVALWCEEENCFFMDSNALIYNKTDGAASTTDTDKKLVTIYGVSSEAGTSSVNIEASSTNMKKSVAGSQVLSSKLLSELLTTAETFNQAKLTIESITVVGNSQYIFKVVNNGKIILSDKKPFNVSIEEILSAYHSKAFATSSRFQYIDARFGKKVFYRLSTGGSLGTN